MPKNPLVVSAPSGRPREEVHIIPIGWELDRAVQAFLEDTKESGRLPIHRAYLLVVNPEGSLDFDVDATKRLEKIAKVEVRNLQRKDGTGRHVEFEQIVAEVSRILAKELALGNRVHINLSAGSKIATFAAGLAGMAYLSEDDGSLYYVEPDHYADKEPCDHCKKLPKAPRPLSYGVRAVKVFEPLSLALPSRTLMLVMGFLARQGGEPVPYMQVLQFLTKIKDPLFKGVDVVTSLKGRLELKDKSKEPKVRMRLLRSVIDPLQDGGFVESEKVGRERLVVLTPRGRTYARFAPDPP